MPTLSELRAEIKMSDFKTVSRSQLYQSGDEEGSSSDDQEYNNPPPGFDFEIVDVEDAAEEPEQNGNAENQNIESQEKEEKIEFFPLFSTTEGTNNSTSTDGITGSAGGLVKIKINDVTDVDYDSKQPEKVNDEEWDQIAKKRNESKRPLSFYYQATDSSENGKTEEYKSVAVDGETVIQWSKDFRILTNYRVVDLQKFNATVDLYHKIENSARNGKSRKRAGKKQRDGKIFKKERLKKWKQQLLEANQRAKQRTYRDYDTANRSSTKTKFGDSFKKRSNTVSKNIGRPGKPIFRTE